MKTISVSVSIEDYEAFRQAARAQRRPIAQLIREAMAFYRARRLAQRDRLEELPLVVGHKPQVPLPTRHETYEEIFAEDRLPSLAAEGPPQHAPSNPPGRRR